MRAVNIAAEMEEKMAENQNGSFQANLESLFKGMDSFMTTKTVVGEAIHAGDTIILPLVDVSFGVGAGTFTGEKNNNGGGGIGGKMSPSAVLVIQNGTTKLVNVRNQDGLTKVLDMVPDFVNRFMPGSKDTDETEIKAEVEEETDTKKASEKKIESDKETDSKMESEKK